MRLDFPDGLWGEGEAAPLEPYDGVSMASVRAALDALASVLADAEPTADVLSACAAERSTPAGAGGGRPRALGSRLAPHRDAAGEADRPARRRRGPVNATIGADDRAGAAAAAAAVARRASAA